MIRPQVIYPRPRPRAPEALAAFICLGLAGVIGAIAICAWGLS